MNVTDRHRKAARRFLEVIPLLLHGLGSELRDIAEAGWPVTLQQYRAMAALHHHACSLNELASRHHVSAPAVSRLVSTLVERGWVQREEDPQDRRQVVLTLTCEGETMWNAMAERSTEHLAAMLDDLSPEEMTAMETVLTGLGRVVAARRPVER
jgi:DNA-binding MarR family transcriptional regulator